MGLFSSKPKESEWIEWHPQEPTIRVKATIFDKETDDIKGGTTWSAGYDFVNLRNIIYLVNKIDSISDKLDAVLAQNKELRNRCEMLEQAVNKKR